MSFLEKAGFQKIGSDINWKALGVSCAISLGTGIISTLLTGGAMRRNAPLYQPPLAPPGWLFPVVWTILYILMGIAAYLVWESDSGDRRLSLSLYAVSLFLNGSWSIFFFSMRAYFLALADLLALWLVIYLMIKQFRESSLTAARLLYPYLAWVSFAGYLNLAIAIRGR